MKRPNRKYYIGDKTVSLIADLELYIEYLEGKMSPKKSRLGVGVKVSFKGKDNIIGEITDSSEVGFNHWMVRWDRTGEICREYGGDLTIKK